MSELWDDGLGVCAERCPWGTCFTSQQSFGEDITRTEAQGIRGQRWVLWFGLIKAYLRVRLRFRSCPTSSFQPGPVVDP